MYTTSCTNTHHNTTNFEVSGMVLKIKSWISQEQNMNFAWNRKILKFYLKDYTFKRGMNFKIMHPPKNQFFIHLDTAFESRQKTGNTEYRKPYYDVKRVHRFPKNARTFQKFMLG